MKTNNVITVGRSIGFGTRVCDALVRAENDYVTSDSTVQRRHHYYGEKPKSTPGG